jgi:hypothetical protein
MDGRSYSNSIRQVPSDGRVFFLNNVKGRLLFVLYVAFPATWNARRVPVIGDDELDSMRFGAQLGPFDSTFRRAIIPEQGRDARLPLPINPNKSVVTLRTFCRVRLLATGPLSCALRYHHDSAVSHLMAGTITAESKAQSHDGSGLHS